MSSLLRAACLSGLRRHFADAGSVLRSASASAFLQVPSGSVVVFGQHFSTSTPASTTDEQEDAIAVENYRAAKNFRRRVDGRVLLHGKESNKWMEAKLDGYVEGSLLLLGPDCHVYYLVSEGLKQIDLSNDQLIGQLFGEGNWEGLMQPLYSQVTDGELKHVRMTPQQFRSIFTVLREAPPSE